jgi:hypothetical protein
MCDSGTELLCVRDNLVGGLFLRGNKTLIVRVQLKQPALSTKKGPLSTEEIMLIVLKFKIFKKNS